MRFNPLYYKGFGDLNRLEQITKSESLSHFCDTINQQPKATWWRLISLTICLEMTLLTGSDVKHFDDHGEAHREVNVAFGNVEV